MPKSSPLSLRLPAELLTEIRKEAKRSARPASQVIQTTLEEGMRMRRCPGIIFTNGPAGRRATVAGTGIDVWEVVRVSKSVGGNFKATARALPQLSRPQIDSALHYYRLYTQEIDERLDSEEDAYDALPSQPFIRRFGV
jgi:uncharacterized protein (DUF433 family)